LISPTVTVIVPAFNAANTLGATLESVRGQSFRQWEAVVIDDGSTDQTADLVAGWSALDERVRYHPMPSNRGVSAARNAGLAKAHGEYLIFLDADDWIGRHHLARLVRALERDPSAGGAYTGYSIATEDGKLGPSVHPPDPQSLFQYAARTCPFAIHACLVKRDLVEAVGGFDDSLVIAEDWDLWQRLARRGTRFLRLHDCSAFYRACAGSATRVSECFIRDALKVIQRGHTQDTRVRDARPEHELGEPAADLPAASFSFLVWVTGYLLGAHANLPLECSRFPQNVLDYRETRFGSMFFDGLLQGAGCTAENLAARWTVVWPAIAGALPMLRSCSASPLNEHIIRREVERCLLSQLGPVPAPATIGRSHVVSARLEDDWTAIEVPKDVDLVRVNLALKDWPLGAIELPAAARELSRREGCAAALRKCRGGSEIRRIVESNPLRLRRLLGRGTPHFLWDLLHAPRSQRRKRLKAYLSARINRILSAELSVVPDETTSKGSLSNADQVTSSQECDPEQAAWDAVFANPDPWNYGSSYEQTKYQHTLELLPEIPINRALELACAEGHFTAMLGPCVGHLLAADISDVALSRARQRCRGLSNLTFQRLNLRDALPGGFDLIVCSEVLYYLRDRSELLRLGRRLAKSINPGGYLLMTHANLVVDDNGVTGFDWECGFGAKFIGETFSKIRDLEPVRELRTPLYRVQLLRRRPRGNSRRIAVRELVGRDAATPTDPAVYGRVKCGGCVVTLARSYGTYVTRQLPILMYHRIASHGPEELAPYRVSPASFERQLAYLRAHGYISVGLGEWIHALSTQDGCLPGRLVCLTFDDGYRDFLSEAWPLLKRYGFSATVFAATELVGGRAEWDCNFGAPAELLSWQEIRTLAAEGVTFGAHGATHRYLRDLSVADMLAEGNGSRERLQAQLGQHVDIMAYPFGDHDNLVQNAMQLCGYSCAVTVEPRLSGLGDDFLALPRQEISGSDTLEDFISKLGRRQRARIDQRLRYQLSRLTRRSLWAE
jgi:peptidoglycan/xylan/chitin deacetylase (PgdA/CDA1 family)/2-polyprenyl-3-methyl-5-hydroxy-6-metoxy-1,4-benzoquinol methylase